ncbi:hypothetical protein KI387_036394, partial [Taxus chinensis]
VPPVVGKKIPEESIQGGVQQEGILEQREPPVVIVNEGIASRSRRPTPGASILEEVEDEPPIVEELREKIDISRNATDEVHSVRLCVKLSKIMMEQFKFGDEYVTTRFVTEKLALDELRKRISKEGNVEQCKKNPARRVMTLINKLRILRLYLMTLSRRDEKDVNKPPSLQRLSARNGMT